MAPVSEHSFILKASKKLFSARTKDDNIFLKDPRNVKHLKAMPLNSKAKKELDLHRAIKLRLKDNVCLYVANRMGYCFPTFCFPNKKKFMKLFSST